MHGCRIQPKCLLIVTSLEGNAEDALTGLDKLFHHHRGQAGIQPHGECIIKSLFFYELDGHFVVQLSVCNMSQYI